MFLDETLRLTPSLYFLPRRATVDTWIETADGRKLFMPAGTHILLDIWHANRHEDHWGVRSTGYPAIDIVPERWAEMSARGRESKEIPALRLRSRPESLPWKTSRAVGSRPSSSGAFVKLFKFKAENPENPAKAGVSTKPVDGALADLELR